MSDSDNPRTAFWEKLLIYGGFSILLIAIVTLLVFNGLAKQETYDSALQSLQKAADAKPALWVAHFEHVRGREVACLETLTQLLGFSLAVLGGAMVVFGARAAFSLDLHGGAALGKAAISSTSPGLVLVVLGVTVVIVSVAVPAKFDLSLTADGQAASLAVDAPRVAATESTPDPAEVKSSVPATSGGSRGRSIASVDPPTPVAVPDQLEAIASALARETEKREEMEKALAELGGLDQLAGKFAEIKALEQQAVAENMELKAKLEKLENENGALRAQALAHKLPLPREEPSPSIPAVPPTEVVPDPFSPGDPK